jgi:hypothetical protein
MNDEGMSMDDLDAYITAASAMIGIGIADEHRPGVRTFLQIAQQMAATLDTAPLDGKEFALAAVYLPPEQADE